MPTMRRFSYRPALVALAAVLLALGCTRPENHQANVSLSLPQTMPFSASTKGITSMTAGILAHLVINVRGSGINVPISQSYQIDKSANPPLPLPSDYTLELPTGTARLFQVLAVYVDPASGVAEFYYGEAKKDLSGSSVALTIPVALVGSGALEGGKVAGRYIGAGGVSPSGLLEQRILPAGASFPMVVARRFMANGWFEAFALETMAFELVLVPSETTVLSAYTLNSFTFADNKKMKIQTPNGTMQFGSGNSYSRGGGTTLIGFFGPGVTAAHKVCFTSPNYTFTQYFTMASPPTPVLWSNAVSNTATNATTNVMATKHGSVSGCSDADMSAAYTSVLPFNPVLLDYWGGDEAVVGYQGIFRFPLDLTNGASPVRVSYDNTGHFQTSFLLLPGMESVADQIRIYYRPSKTPKDYEGDNGPPCTDLANGKYGFRSIADIPLVSGTSAYNRSLPSPNDINADAVMAFCPSKGGVVLNAGFALDRLNNNSGVSGTPLDPPSFIDLGASPPNYDLHPWVAGIATPDATIIKFFSDATCMAPIGTGDVSAFNSIGVLLNLTANTSYDIYSRLENPDTNRASACTYLTSYATAGPLEATDFQWETFGGAYTLGLNRCRPISVDLIGYVDGQQTTNVTNPNTLDFKVTLDPTVSPSRFNLFDSETNCNNNNTPVPSPWTLTFGAGVTTKTFWIRAINDSTSGDQNMTLTPPASMGNALDKYALFTLDTNVFYPTQFVFIKTNTSDSSPLDLSTEIQNSNNCVALDLEPRDSAGLVAAPDVDIHFNLEFVDFNNSPVVESQLSLVRDCADPGAIAFGPGETIPANSQVVHFAIKFPSSIVGSHRRLRVNAPGFSIGTLDILLPPPAPPLLTTVTPASPSTSTMILPKRTDS